jgi:hypothetical protein
MAQSPNASLPQPAPEENNRATLIRSIWSAIFVLILWLIDKLAVSRLSQGSVWRYIVGGAIISVGLVTVITFAGRFVGKNS